MELYRLRQVDIDGEFKLYGPISLECDSETIDRIYPNPVKDQFVLSTASSKDEHVTYTIFNNQGFAVWNQETHLNSGNNNILFVLPSLVPGVYYMKNNLNDQVSRIVIAQ